jgi:signal transduction histidine kinase
MRGMQERIKSLGGRMTVNSDQSGTSIVVALPIPRKE